MSISRRQFILGASGAAAGFILPSFYDKALSYFENHGEPLIVLPKESDIELLVCNYGSYQLHLGDPTKGPPAMTYREYAIWNYGSVEDYLYDSDPEDIDLDAIVEPWMVEENWYRSDGTTAQAYHLLAPYDLGPEFSGAESVGSLEFIDGPCPGNDYLGVEAADLISISLLQKRLNDLNTGIRISMDD